MDLFVCRLYEVMETKEKIFLCMQLAPGGELFTRLTQHGQYQVMRSFRVSYEGHEQRLSGYS
jgi:hypothetical protein